MPNQLATSRSPYLLQHAENPVDWHPWSDEAFEQARARDKPVLVSIGYSACHWCHVMAHESFENVAVARLMNDNFVSIKVDREERPDVDTVYMEALQLLGAQGGWPLNIFLTPDRKPFFGGTYWPPSPRHGMPSWTQVLQAISLGWTNDRERLMDSAESLAGVLGRSAELGPSSMAPGPDILQEATQRMADQFDTVHGGFGGAPKFPQATNLEFLLRTYHRTGDKHTLNMVELTLRRMQEGGIHDQLGGGFHRYTVDGSWTLPHFEKMLYDNALLGLVYTHAFQTTGDTGHRSVVENLLDYILRDLTSPEGAFYASEDADSGGREGAFYVWTPEELREVLTPEEADVFCQYYGVTAAGNFEGTNILTVAERLNDIGADSSAPGARAHGGAAAEPLARARAAALRARLSRPRPGRDEKILTGWNALMLRAFALAGRVFRRRDYADAAERNCRFLLEHLRVDGRLMHVYNGGPGQTPAFLDDYAYLIEALVVLYETSFDTFWLAEAVALAGTMIELFSDDSRGGFFDTASTESGGLPVRPKTLFDGATPSGNASAATGLLRLAALTGNRDFESAASGALSALTDLMAAQPLALGKMLCALDFHLAAPREVVIIGESEAADTEALMCELFGHYLPNTVIAGAAPAHLQEADSIARNLPLLSGRFALDGHATAYVCEDYVCRQPVTAPADLASLLGPSVQKRAPD